MFDTDALRQAANMPWPDAVQEQQRLYVQNATDLYAAADYIDELEAALMEAKATTDEPA